MYEYMLPLIYIVVGGFVGFALGLAFKRRVISLIPTITLVGMLAYLSIELGIAELKGDRLAELTIFSVTKLFEGNLTGLGLVLGFLNLVIGLIIGVKRSVLD